MGLFDMFRRMGIGRRDETTAKTALRDARAGRGASDAITATILRILSLGLDGRGPYKGAAAVGAAALRANGGDAERAIDALARRGVRSAAAGGLVTGLGGFVTLPVAIPANLLEFYVTATRTVGAIASLRGYDVTDPTIRTAVLLTLVGSRSTDILNVAGVSLGSNVLGGLVERRLPPAAVMMIDKAVGFQLLKALGEKTLAGFGRAVPLLGGAVGAVADGAMLARIARHARTEFPKHAEQEQHRDWGVR